MKISTIWIRSIPGIHRIMITRSYKIGKYPFFRAFKPSNSLDHHQVALLEI